MVQAPRRFSVGNLKREPQMNFKTWMATSALSLISIGAVQANTVVLHGFTNGYEAIDTTLTGYVGVGRFGGELDGSPANSFSTYCTDLYQSFNWNTPYTDYSAAANGSAHGFSLSQANLLGKLYTAAGPQGTLGHDQTVAFQLAVWEITHDIHPVSISSGQFAREAGGSATQINLANSWLTAVHSPGAGSSYQVQRLYSPTQQDFILYAAVPEPSTYALLLAGLGVVGWVSRRRSKSQA